ncbi:hypothetical protein [Candidatus Viridilinea mediisalina]|uniref:Uncharacterized protein n=1 Tax=Candidatus Viridilinea mediisalina TaxID=2024553 RepID=A0A2A6RF12_9CHLR|nr:hypothetical protein [Candidatus Viridilinea mediisalina]PDW01476.1 hypothetical protein CJ255_18900 [Candidatus Viridilinea mediisalina]
MANVERLIEAILLDEEIMAHPSLPGLTRARLREAAARAGFDPHRFGRFSAALMLWFTRAGVIVPEETPSATAWARPIPLSSDDRATLRSLLTAVSPPDGEAVAHARSEAKGMTR